MVDVSAPATAAAVIGAAYLVGSIPVALLVGRRAGVVDLRAVGDHNPGYWNAKAQLGRRSALPVFVGDAAKGVVAGLLGTWASPPWGVAYGAVAAAMVGHAFPVFARFRGGRAVLTFAGGVCVLCPRAAAVAIAALVVVTMLTRSFAWGARTGVFGYPLAQFLFDTPNRVAATGALMAIIGLRFAMAAGSGARARPSPAGPPPS